ncbi:unnamed protein product [Nippostrongylus brasiliensis]|uniref:Putative metallophosphoesterase (inferred by orthology to a C. elegans protein) n=1 Tax=Nippostrongylus brasiliensis TaxID=27835 RepID=A0A0N4YUU6_NIPBR|nr:unnamed protein product [Nippostrongylus brasiliensis]
MHGNVEEWFDYLTACNITVLHNSQKRFITTNGDQICVAGADDLYAAKAHFPGHEMHPERAVAGCERNDTVIMLAHQPNAAKMMLRNDVVSSKLDLILSGKTSKIVVTINSYKFGSKRKNAKYAENVVDDEDDGLPIVARKLCETTKEIDQPIHASTFALDKKPFCAINADLVPAFIDDPKEFFDEFGFRKGDDSFQATSAGQDDIEESSHRMRFLAAIEFAHPNVKEELIWSKVNIDSLYSEKMEELIKAGGLYEISDKNLSCNLCFKL